MKYGVYLPNFGCFGDARALANLACDAEQAGWDGFFIWDHVAGMHQPMVDPWVGLAAVAMVTEHIRIGTTVTPLPRRRPWKLARETVSLDRLSNGRLTLSVGIGLGDAEWGNLGEETNLKARGAMLDEALDVLTGLWSGESFSYEGKYYHIHQAQFLPTPVQSPRIPIWVGGFWPHKAPFRRAARWDGVYPLFETWEQEHEQLKDALAYVQAKRTRDAPFDIVCTGVTPGDDPAQAAAILAPYRDAGVTWWLEGIAPYRWGQDLEGDWPCERLRQRVLEGPPGECHELYGQSGEKERNIQ
ncbi:MAG: TIGR03619 family F420-dependent LLM class oxidoreductase [Anaerolineae bacterium]|nr:TIGR03619 family F420-dependent LLM class oxidoreductase [Anaerolineae bacterium]